MRLVSTLLTLSLVVACNSNKKSMADAPVATPNAFVVAGDFSLGHPGVFAGINTQTMTVTPNTAPQGAVGDDPQLRRFGGKLYVINRSDGNNVTILDSTTLALVDQLGTGANSNPQDVAVTSTNLYAPILGGSGVAVLTPGSTAVTVIDLSAGATTAGLPDCVANTLVGTQLFVACEELDNNNMDMATVPGEIFIVDTTTNTVTGSFALQNEEPVGTFHQLPNGDLAIATANYSATSPAGCIEEITTTGTPTSKGCMTGLTLAALGGYVNRFELQENAGSDTVMWLSVARTDFSAQTLYSFDLTTSTLSAAISPPSELIGDLALCSDGTIVVSDQTKGAGVRIYKNNHEVTTAPLAVGLDTQSNYALVCL
jgi:hypothetical protein